MVSNRDGAAKLHPDAPPSDGRSLVRRNTLWMLVANAVSAAAQWAVILVLAKTDSATAVGRYTYALAIAAPIMLFAQMNLRMVQAVDTRQAFLFFDYLSLRAAASLLALVATGICLAVFGSSRAATALILLIMASRSIEGMSDIVHGATQQLERMHAMARSLVLRAAVQLALVVGALHVTHNVTWAAMALALGAAIVLLGHDLPLAMRIVHSSEEPLPVAAGFVASGARLFSVPQMRRLILVALPMGIMAVFGSLYQNIPRYFIEHDMGYASVGYYSAFFYLVFVGYTAVGAMGNALAPALARDYHFNRSSFRRRVVNLLGVGLVLGVLGILAALVAGERILTILYRPDYARQVHVFVWVMISAAVWYEASLLVHVAVAAGRTSVQAPLHAMTAVITAAGCWLWVPRHGLVGAVVSLTIGVAALAVSEAAVVVAAAQRQRSV